jgi:beta-1,4-mannosyl-glycoprotein beta-1,4-N-acetylglucosaminyltransferase
MTYREFRDSWQSLGQSLRDQRNMYSLKVQNGGWHFGWLGGYEMVKAKVEAFAHSEFDNETIHNELKEDVKLIRPFFCGSNKSSMPIVEIDETYPKYLLDNLSKYQHLIYKQID